MKHNAALKIILAIIALLAAFAAVQAVRGWLATERAKKLKNPVEASLAVLAEGKQLYGFHCQKCHGEKGDGRGEKAGELFTKPTDFTDVSGMSRLTDGEMFVAVMQGKRPMPAFEDKLTDEQGWELVDYVRTFAPAKNPAR